MADAPPAGIDLDVLFHKSSVFDSSRELEKRGFKVLRDKADKVKKEKEREEKRTKAGEKREGAEEPPK